METDEFKPGLRVRWNKYRDLRESGWLYGTVKHRIPKPAHNTAMYVVIDDNGKGHQKTDKSLHVVSGVTA
jgi:hypothetical protein